MARSGAQSGTKGFKLGVWQRTAPLRRVPLIPQLVGNLIKCMHGGPSNCRNGVTALPK